MDERMKRIFVRASGALAMVAVFQIGAACSPAGDGFKAAAPQPAADREDGSGIVSPPGEPTPTPAPSPSPTPVPIATDPNCTDPDAGTTDAATSRFRVEVCSLVNQARAQYRLVPLRLASLHNRAAQGHAVDMINNGFFDHRGSDGSTPFLRMSAVGIQYVHAGENIAQGQRTSAEVMNGWMNSSGHRANILSTYYRRIGIGYYQRAWVQNFTN